MSTHFRRLKILEIRKETPDCVSILFQVPESSKEAFQFDAGQNLTIRFFFNEEEIRRSYSICSSPFENELRIAVKKVDGGRFSTYANEHLKAGDELEVLPPSGRFSPHLSPANKKHYVAFTAGSGITPVISIIKTTLHLEPASAFTLIYGNRARSSIIFREELEALKNRHLHRFSVFHILSRESAESPLNEGRICDEKCDQLSRIIPLSAADEFFLCGPGDLINSVSAWLEKKGIAKSKIHFEYFTVTGHPATSHQLEATPDHSPSEKSTININSDGVTFSFEMDYDGLTVLDAANALGADLPYACKAGVCSTCRAKLVEGKVEMNVNYSLEQDEIDAGFILTCQSHPRTKIVSIDFDAK